MNTVTIEKNKYAFKGKIYEDNEVESIINKLGKSIRVIILAENLLIKICDNVDINTDKDIEKNIVSNLIIDEDTLVDYIFDKKLKRIYIYSIKQGSKVSRILANANKIIVEPIQYVLVRVIKQMVKYKKNYKALVKLNNYIYFIWVKCERLVYSKIIEENKDDLYNLLLEDLRGESLLVDINLKDIIIEGIAEKENIKNINFINLKEKLDYEISKI